MMNRGTILRGIGGFYTVLDDEGRSYTLRAQGKIRKERLTPLVGDEVEYEPNLTLRPAAREPSARR